MKHIILGTAGHIDHGKSTLVKALTGTDPDRLKEEKERGITIDLGFANLLYRKVAVGIVDVPGHERLIKNMLAGAGGIDMVLLTVAADEAIMPQTREHLSICHLLGILSGLTVITKADLVDEEFLELVVEEVKSFVKGTFLEKAPILPVSAKTGANMDILRETIEKLALKIPEKPSNGPFRLPIDRVFTLKGFGTVITGTAISGRVSVDETLEILPSGLKSKVRGLHSHGEKVNEGFAGQRLAINLQSVDKNALSRGDVVVCEKYFTPTKKINAFIRLLKSAPLLKNGDNVHFHIGTSETVARVIFFDKSKLTPEESAFCQFRLKNPVLAANKDSFIIRRFSPLETIGGGVVLDSQLPNKKRPEDMEKLNTYLQGSLSQKIEEKAKQMDIKGISVSFLKGWLNESLGKIDRVIGDGVKAKRLIYSNDMVFSGHVIENVHGEITKQLKDYHKKNPLKPGIDKEELKAKFKNIDSKIFMLFLSSMENLTTDKKLVSLTSFKPTLSAIDETVKAKLIELLKKSEFQPQTKDEISKELNIKNSQTTDLLKLFMSEGSIVRINDSIYLLEELHDLMLERLKDFYAKDGDMITVSQFRDIVKTTRKYALPYLEYLDGKRITMRVGDKRKIMPTILKSIAEG